MKHAFAAARLDVLAFASAGAALDGEAPLLALTRLAAECHEPGAAPPVHWHAQGQLRRAAGRGEAPWLHLQAQAQPTLVCQRCLEPVPVPIAVDRWFRFAADEAVAATEDEDAEEDVLALAPDFDLLALIEDELLMEWPAVPRHETCPVAPTLQWNEGVPAAALEPARPFASLAALKRGQS